MLRRLAVVMVAAGAALVLGAAPAWADAAGPTDYQSEVIAVDPPAPGVSLETIGGDSFLRLVAEPGLLVEVVGYRGEPYLRFLPSGVVERNENSPSTYLSEDRYGETDIPPTATPDAVPDWRRVATEGSYAWHDHRTHWMNQDRPPGRGPGDQILEGVVPLLVDGAEVDVTVASYWEPAPSVVPVVVGAGAGLLAAVLFRRRIAAAVAIVAAAALGVGITAYLSVPPETGPSPLLWAVPAAALLLAGAALVRQGERWPRYLVLAAAASLVVWAVFRWEWLWRAVLPTAAPFWLDRAAVAAAGAAGLVAAAAVARSLAVSLRAPQGA
jgi:hypothetical protein